MLTSQSVFTNNVLGLICCDLCFSKRFALHFKRIWLAVDLGDGSVLPPFLDILLVQHPAVVAAPVNDLADVGIRHAAAQGAIEALLLVTQQYDEVRQLFLG